jgi:hypothetical protein
MSYMYWFKQDNNQLTHFSNSTAMSTDTIGSQNTVELTSYGPGNTDASRNTANGDDNVRTPEPSTIEWTTSDEKCKASEAHGKQ